MEDKLRPVVDLIHDWWMWICIGIALWLLAFTRLVVRRSKWPTVADKMRDMTMTTVEGRRKYVELKAFQAVCDALLTCVLDGELTDEEANAMMVIFARHLNQEAAQPIIRQRKTAMLKAELRNKKRRRDLTNGRCKTVALPIPDGSKTNSRKPNVKLEEDDEDSLASLLT